MDPYSRRENAQSNKKFALDDEDNYSSGNNYTYPLDDKHRIFIGLENPPSMWGDKRQNHPYPKKRIETKSDFENRIEFYEKNKKYPYKDISAQNDRRVVEEYTKGRAYIDWCAGASLKAMFNQIRANCTQGGKYSTLVFLGHGNIGVMSVGLGNLPLIPPENGGKSDKENAQITRVRELLKPEKREISMHDSQWLTYFTDNKDCLNIEEDSFFHLFLLGCSTGEQGKYKETYRSLITHVAIKLNKLLKIPIAVYGPGNEIDSQHTKAILENLNEFKKGRTKIISKDGVILECEKKK